MQGLEQVLIRTQCRRSRCRRLRLQRLRLLSCGRLCRPDWCVLSRKHVLYDRVRRCGGAIVRYPVGVDCP